jgi:glutathione S-transferase
MKLYFSKGACSLACRIVIHEIGLHVDYISVDLMSKKTEDGQNFLEINPKGAVPTLVTDDNQVLTENVVIQQYLADTSHATQLLPAVGNFKRYQVLEWSNYIATEIHKGFSPLFNPKIPQELKENYFLPQIIQKFNYINHALDNKNFLLGNDFTLPDAYFFVMLIWSLHFKLPLANWPNLTNYFNRLITRPAISESLQEEQLTISAIG